MEGQERGNPPRHWVFFLSFEFFLEFWVFSWVFLAFLDAFPAPRDPKSADFLSFHLEFWVFSWVLTNFYVFLIKLVIFHTKTSDNFKKVPTFWALGLSFEFFPWVLSFFRLEFFFEWPKTACINSVANYKWSVWHPKSVVQSISF